MAYVQELLSDLFQILNLVQVFFNFYHAMLCRARLCDSMSSVHPSVCDIQVLWSHRLEWAEGRSMILVSRNVRYMRIFAGFLGEGASNDSGVVEERNFHRFVIVTGYYVRKLGYIWRLFSDLQIWGGIGVGSGAQNLQYLQNGPR